MPTRKKTWASVFGFIVLMFTAIAWAAPVPDTGQTKCYDVAGNVTTCPSPGQALYGQDANYSINPMSYTKLDGSGKALSDSARSWVMVRDNVTGLIWEIKTNKDGVINYNDPHDADNIYSWYDSKGSDGGYVGTPGNGTDTEDFIKALNDAKFGGYTDWRLPRIKELNSIANLDIASPGPTINTTYFLNTVSSFYWSSTTYVNVKNYSWGVYFNHCYDDDTSKSSRSYVRAVRGGQSGLLGNSVIGSFDSMDSGSIDDSTASAGSYTDNGNGTVSDTSTGLMWQQTGSSQKTWEQALAYCEGLNLGGHTDWRLPSIKELRSLVDYNQYNPAINTTHFPDTIAAFYWSSTSNANNTNNAWDMNFTNGGDSYNVKKNSSYVRAVRGGQAATPTCTSTINENLLLHIPYLSYGNGILSLWTNFVYEFNPMYPTLIPFKLTDYGVLNNPSFSCSASTLSDNFKIHIPDVLLPDGVTHLWLDLEYRPILSTDANFFWVITNGGVISN